MVSWAKLGSDRVNYYELSVAQGRENYYRGAGEAQGRWFGEGAVALGLAGELTAGQLTKLSSGLHPVTGEQLRETAGVKPAKAIGAFDFTFSVAKSVSLLYSSGDRELSTRILDAQHRAVESSLKVLESEAAFVRRGKGGHIREHARIIVSRYDHRTSRLSDPQLHEHDIVSNTALGPDGRWTALDSVRMRDFKMALGAIHEAELRANLSELGLSWRPLDAKGLTELDCVDRGTLRDFSKRRQQLERDVRGDVENPAAMAGAAVRTRQAKREVDMPALQREVADKLGAELIDSVRDLTRSKSPLEVGGGDHERLAGPTGLTEMRNTFSRNDVIVAIARGAPQGIHAAEVIRQTDRFLARDDLVVALDNGRYSTHDLIAAEQAREEAQLGRADARAGIVREKPVRDSLRHFTLNDDQDRVVRDVFSSGRGVEIIESEAGTGKTYLAGAIRDVAEMDGRRVIGTGPTARAARELEKQAGISESYTLDALLRRLDRGDIVLGPRDYVVGDEMGMAGTRPSARLEQHAADANCKLVEIRDSKQLQSVLAGGELQGVHEQLGGLKLGEVVRQNDPEERRALGRLHGGDVESWVRFQEDRERLAYGATLEQAVAAYSRNVQDVGFDKAAFVVPTNAMAKAANDIVRDERARNGELGKGGVIGDLEVAEGDRVIFRLNDHHDRMLQVSNGDRGTVTRLRGTVGLEVQLDTGVHRIVNGDYIEAGYLQLGYAGTVHTHQGQTVDRTVVAGRADEMYAELAYVAATRARDTTELFVIGTENGRDQERAEIGPVDRGQQRDQRAELVKTMGESRGEQLAIEQLPERQLDRGYGLEL